MKENNSRKMKLMLAFSMAIFGTIGLFSRQISVSSGELALYRAILAVVLIGIYLIVTKEKIDYSAIKNEIFLLTLSGFAIGFN